MGLCRLAPLAFLCVSVCVLDIYSRRVEAGLWGDVYDPRRFATWFYGYIFSILSFSDKPWQRLLFSCSSLGLDIRLTLLHRRSNMLFTKHLHTKATVTESGIMHLGGVST